MLADQASPPIRALVVFRSPKALSMKPKEIAATTQLRQQYRAIGLYAKQNSQLIEGGGAILVRTNAIYFPTRDAKLLASINDAKASRRMLVVDDIFRLLDCRNPDQAWKEFEGLRALEPPIYSLDHDRQLREMPPPFVARQIGARYGASQLRSAQVKKGLKESDENTGPSRRAIKKAVQAKKRRSHGRAHRAMKEIELVQDKMPAETRSNLKAIADALNTAEVKTPSGHGEWQGSMVKRVFDRLGRKPDD